jgi:hypothetical protein
MFQLTYYLKGQEDAKCVGFAVNSCNLEMDCFTLGTYLYCFFLYKCERLYNGSDRLFLNQTAAGPKFSVVSCLADADLSSASFPSLSVLFGFHFF